MGNDSLGVTRLMEAVEKLEHALDGAVVQSSDDTAQATQLQQENNQLKSTQLTVKKRLDKLISKISSQEGASL